MKVTLVAHTPNPLYVCAEAASVCYDSEPSLKIIKGCIRSGHTSVLEHSSFTFRIEGISRACSHQVVRHRIASYSQQSQRYVTYDNLDWALDNVNKLRREDIAADCDMALLQYKKLLDKDVPADQARMVLPNATPTTVYVTMNIRSLMNFFNERLCSRASKEIRLVAQAMREAILSVSDISEEETKIFETIFVPKCERQDIAYCPEIKSCGKHPTLKNLVYPPEAAMEESR